MPEHNTLFHDPDDIEVGDVIAYVGAPKWDLRTRSHYEQELTERDWLTVSRIDDAGVHGYRVNPEDWERDIEFVVVPKQIQAHGVMKRGE